MLPCYLPCFFNVGDPRRQGHGLPALGRLRQRPQRALRGLHAAPRRHLVPSHEMDDLVTIYIYISIIDICVYVCVVYIYI